MRALKLPFKFDAEKIAEEIAQFSDKDYYFIYNPYVEVDTLKSKHLIEPKIGEDDLPVFLPNDALKKCPYLMQILETFKCDKETFRIHSLAAGAEIRPHRDVCCSFEHGKIRLHIPVKTNSDVLLQVNDQTIPMKPGECWYCNFDIKHEVHNNSTEDRVHLIMDCLVNEWVKDIFADKSKEVIN